ncbi:MAG: acetoin utilization protein AcuC [Nitrososphaerota archaeon]
MLTKVALVKGPELLKYSFPAPHPMNSRRIESFYKRIEMLSREVLDALEIVTPKAATTEEIALFHDPSYIEFVKKKSAEGRGYLDLGDTPSFPGIFEAACYVVGSTLELCRTILSRGIKRGFNPMGGLHHARRSSASGFCVFNDAAVAIVYLLKVAGLETVAYVDIDAHHGDGVCYEFYDDKRVVFADIHQDGRTLYPGTGFRHERGRGEGEGLKLNIPLPPGSGDEEFRAAMLEIKGFLMEHDLDFILFQCGADGVVGDPITNLSYTAASHRFAAEVLCDVANKKCGGRMLAMGGGGYNPENTAEAWTSVVKAFIEKP